MAILVLLTKPLGLTPISVVVDVADLILVETYRRARRLSTRAQAVRELIARGLEPAHTRS
jgi:hypothetical protein